MIIRNIRSGSKRQEEEFDRVGEDAEEVCYRREESSSKKGAQGKNGQVGHQHRGVETSNTAKDKAGRKGAKSQAKRQAKSEKDGKKEESEGFEVIKVIKKKRYTLNPVTNEREEFKPQGKEVVFPEMEIMLCQIILGFNAHGFHATQSDLSQLALRMLQFMSQHGFYEEHEPDLNTLAAKQQTAPEKIIAEDEASVSSLGEMEEEDSLLGRPKSKKTLFRASKGWVEKFLLRNERIALIYRFIRDRDYRRHYKKIGKERLSWLIRNPTWDALLQKNAKNWWEKDNDIAYVPPYVAESSKKIIKKGAKGTEKKEKQPRKKREPKEKVTEVRVDPREEEERLKLKYQMSEESYSFNGSIVREKIRLPSGQRMMVHYDRNNPGKIIQQKIVPGDDNHPNSCEKGNEQSRKSKVVSKSRKIKKEKKTGKHRQAKEQEAYERMVDESSE